MLESNKRLILKSIFLTCFGGLLVVSFYFIVNKHRPKNVTKITNDTSIELEESKLPVTEDTVTGFFLEDFVKQYTGVPVYVKTVQNKEKFLISERSGNIKSKKYISANASFKPCFKYKKGILKEIIMKEVSS